MLRYRVRAPVGSAAAVSAAMALLSGCGLSNFFTNHGVARPMTPDESRAQVVDAATDVVRALKLTVTSANFSRASCNDQSDPPFHGEVTIFYPSDAGRADNEVEHMTHTLLGAGWTSDGGFKSHATALTKGNVNAVFYPANASVAKGHIDLIGECRDVTTTKAHAGIIEDLSLR